MDFFSHQEDARRNTTKLVVLFALAVLGIIAVLYAVAIAVYATQSARTGATGVWHPGLFGIVSAGVLLVVGTGSLYKSVQLRAGGSVVATQLGGRIVQPNTRDQAERRLINVVEEMAVASGTPVPALYVLDGEKAINAFAAGLTPGDAAIGVTRGCIEQLNRDELQGVIAHEFSHILNGDMRLNIRLMGVLHGILCIGLAGYVILRSGGGFRSRGGKNSGAAAILAMGLSMLVVGYIGVFFAKMIQAAVSRQREFLADASAVQFTRNPNGIAGALKRIGGFATGSRLTTPKAAAASHLFFGNALGASFLGRAMATHPPLEERIRRIDRGFVPRQAADAKVTPVAAPGTAGFAGASDRRAGMTPERLVRAVGSVTDEHLAFTRRMLDGLPLRVHAALHEPFSARALVYALLLDENAERRRAQMHRLEQQVDGPTLQEATLLVTELRGLDPAARLPLLDLAVPALREMSAQQQDRFRRDVRALVWADQRVDLFEFALQKVLLRHLHRHFDPPESQRVRFHRVQPLLDDACVLVSRLAHEGHAERPQVAAAYMAGMRELPNDGYARPLLGIEACDFDRVDRALDRFARSSPSCRRSLLRAAAETAAHDGMLEPAEIELLRAIADTLDCPMPPVVRDAAPAAPSAITA